LAEHLIKVSNDQKLYESYHSWRKEPLPHAFLEKYNISNTHSKCRTCRWAYAKKYGLGWNHTSQSLEPVLLPRETCVIRHYLTSPAEESWWAHNSGNNELELAEFGHVEFSCPLTNNGIARARVGQGELYRSIWSYDGTTDMYIEGHASSTYKLRLAFPMKDHKTIQSAENLFWIQNDISRISIALQTYNEHPQFPTATATSGVFEVHIYPDMLPLRVRIIVENFDTLHRGADEQASYYGQMMADDIRDHPQLFFVPGSMDQAKLTSLQPKTEATDLHLSSLHMKGAKYHNG
jgi:hypothetical protein